MKVIYALLLCLFFSSSIFAQSQTPTPTKIVEVPKPIPVTSIVNIKIALKDLGYDVDLQDNNTVIDAKTSKALNQFRKDYNLYDCMPFYVANFLFTKHKEHLEKETPQNNILKIKIALKDLGYDVDTLHSRDILDPKTRKAYTQFQKDYGAPVTMPHEQLRFLLQIRKEHLESQK